MQDLDINPTQGDPLRARGGSAPLEAGRLGLSECSDTQVSAVLEAARLLRVVTLLALEPRSPGLAQGLAAVLRMWRETGEYTQAEMTEDYTSPASSSQRKYESDLGRCLLRRAVSAQTASTTANQISLEQEGARLRR